MAVELSEETKNELEKLIQEVKKLDLDATTVKREQLHVTLAFLGELDETEATMIVEKLKEVRFGKFDFEVKGTGFFPNPSFVRVFWVGAENAELSRLQKTIAERINYVEDKEFFPHVTIARITGRRNVEELKNLAGRYAQKSFGVTRANRFVLKKSLLTPKGPIYEDVAEVMLE